MSTPKEILNLKRSPRGRFRGKLLIPSTASPLVRQFYELLNRHDLILSDVSKPTGITRSTIWNWPRKNNPNLPNFEAALNAIGYELKIVPKEQ